MLTAFTEWIRKAHRALSPGLFLVLLIAGLHAGALADSPGFAIGDTWLEQQQYGSTGRQIDVAQGQVQSAWTRAVGPSLHLGPTSQWNRASVTSAATPLLLDNGETIDILGLGSPLLPGGQPILSSDSSRHCSLRLIPDNSKHCIVVDMSWSGRVFSSFDISAGLAIFPAATLLPPVGGDNFAAGVQSTITFVGADTIMHVVGNESDSFLIRQNIYYWRGDLSAGGNSQTWASPVLIDSATAASAIIEASPVSSDVAIVYTVPRGTGADRFDNDVCYRRSTDGGLTWGSRIDITSFSGSDRERACTEVSAVYGYDNTLHIAYNTVERDTVLGTLYLPCKLWHWNSSRATSRLVAVADWKNSCSDLSPERGDEWNLQIAKPSLVIKPSGAGPGGGIPDEVIYLAWVQFGPTDVDCAALDTTGAPGGYVNGEIYGAASSNGGLTWSSPKNFTGTATPDCLPGTCHSEGWATAAAYADSGIYLSYVDDRHAGAVGDGEGQWTLNPFRLLAVASYAPPSSPRIALDPGFRPYNSEPGDLYNIDVVALTDRNSSFGLGIQNLGTGQLDFTATVLPDNGGTTHLRINGGSSYSNSIAAAGSEIPTTVEFDGIGLNHGDSAVWTLRIVSNDSDHDTLLVHLNASVRDPVVTITGTVFNDLDSSGTWEPGTEPGLNGWVIHAEPGGYADTTDTLGAFELGDLPAGIYTVSEDPKPGWICTQPGAPAAYVVEPTVGDILDLTFGNHSVGCPVVMTGDINLSGTITSADIINLVNYVFKSGTPPLPCVAAGDVNCGGTVTSADVIALVNYVFKGGAAPCDACTSPLAEGC